jgi:hypothetical protein
VHRRRSCRSHLLLLAAALVLTLVRPLDAASFALTPAEREEAIRLGRKSVITTEFGGEWKVRGEGPDESLVVMTPFHRLALAARNSAFKSEEMRPRDVDSLMRDQQGKLVVWATVRGPRADFARFYVPALLRGQQEIKPSFVQNEHTALREEDGRFTARCLYVFPSEGLAPDDKVTLVVRDRDQRAMARFTVDLAAMR